MGRYIGLVEEFFVHWKKLVERGGVSPMDRFEVAAIGEFADWLDVWHDEPRRAAVDDQAEKGES